LLLLTISLPLTYVAVSVSIIVTVSVSIFVSFLLHVSRFLSRATSLDSPPSPSSLDGSLKKCGAMGAAFVAKDGRVQARSVAVFGQPSSFHPELTGIALALEECPIEEDHTILTDSLSSMNLLQSMQTGDFPLSLYRHGVRHLLLHVVTRLNRRAAAGHITRFIKVLAHRIRAHHNLAQRLWKGIRDASKGWIITTEAGPGDCGRSPGPAATRGTHPRMATCLGRAD
jgi:hypothetical protein